MDDYGPTGYEHGPTLMPEPVDPAEAEAEAQRKLKDLLDLEIDGAVLDIVISKRGHDLFALTTIHWHTPLTYIERQWIQMLWDKYVLRKEL